MLKIVIDSISCMTYVGCNPEEQLNIREVIIDLKLTLNCIKSINSDSLDNTANYADLVDNIILKLKTAKHFTLEALSATVASICFTYKTIEKVDVVVKKPNAISNIEMVSVSLSADRGLF